MAEIRKENQNSQAASSQKGNSHQNLGKGNSTGGKSGIFLGDWSENLAAWKENSQLEGESNPCAKKCESPSEIFVGF